MEIDNITNLSVLRITQPIIAVESLPIIALPAILSLDDSVNMETLDVESRDLVYEHESATKPIATTNVTSCEIVVEHEQIENNENSNIDSVLL